MYQVFAALHNCLGVGLFVKPLMKVPAFTTLVPRGLVGDRGLTYNYFNLRMFAHPWSSIPGTTSAAAACRGAVADGDGAAPASSASSSSSSLRSPVAATDRRASSATRPAQQPVSEPELDTDSAIALLDRMCAYLFCTSRLSVVRFNGWPREDDGRSSSTSTGSSVPGGGAEPSLQDVHALAKIDRVKQHILAVRDQARAHAHKAYLALPPSSSSFSSAASTKTKATDQRQTRLQVMMTDDVDVEAGEEEPPLTEYARLTALGCDFNCVFLNWYDGARIFLSGQQQQQQQQQRAQAWRGEALSLQPTDSWFDTSHRAA
jgi:hypothetical protein